MENNIEKVNLRFIFLHSCHRIVTNFQILLASSTHPAAYSARPAASSTHPAAYSAHPVAEPAQPAACTAHPAACPKCFRKFPPKKTTKKCSDRCYTGC